MELSSARERHPLSAEMMTLAEGKCLIMFTTLVWLLTLQRLSSTLPEPVLVHICVAVLVPVPISVSTLVSIPAPAPDTVPIMCFLFSFPPRPRSRPRFHCTFVRSPPPSSRSRSIPVAILIYVLVPAPDPVPVSISAPDSDPAPNPVRSFPSLGPGYPLGTTRVHRHGALSPELSGARKRHPLPGEMMTRAELKCLL